MRPVRRQLCQRAYCQRIDRPLATWYRERSKEDYPERLAACFPRAQHLGVPLPEMAIRTMKTRWGSISPAGRITLNVKLIRVPKPRIDYVIFYELCHL